MTLRFIFALTLATTMATSSFAQSRSLVLTPAAADDLRASSLVAAPSMPLANTSRDPVSFSWPAVDAPATIGTNTFRAESRSFGVTVSATDLASGVTLRVDAPGAVVRVSGQRAGQQIDPDQLMVVLASGRELNALAATDQLVSREDLAAAGMNVAGQGLGIRLARELGAGEFTLRYPSSRRDDQVRIDVFDRNSDHVLALQSVADQFHSARTAALAVSGPAAAKGARMQGFALAPDGTQHALAFGADGRARLASPARSSFQRGLWEWHVQTIDVDGLQRDAKTVFALSPAVARLDNTATVDARGADVTVTLGTEVRSAGRYEVRATLAGTAKDGSTVDALTSATAAWLESGSGTLTLHFDAATIKAMGLQAPFELRNLSLRDQSRMGVLELRRSALAF